MQDHLQTALNLYESKWEGKLTTLPQMLCWAWRNRTLVYLQVWRHHLSDKFACSVEAVLIDWFCPRHLGGVLVNKKPEMWSEWAENKVLRKFNTNTTRESYGSEVTHHKYFKRQAASFPITNICLNDPIMESD